MTLKHHLHNSTPPAAPSPWLMPLELRALWELGSLVPAWFFLRNAPKGDGHSVIVFPGLSANDGSAAPPMPITSIFSRTDGVVAWPASVQAPCPINPLTENLEVIASHLGLGMNPSAWWALADRLSQPEGEWKHFERRRGLHGMISPDPDR